MAIVKAITDRFGVPITYHRITAVNMVRGGELEISVDSYLSEETFRAGLSAVISGVYRFYPGEWPDEWSSGTAATPSELYALLKTKTDFENGEDAL